MTQPLTLFLCEKSLQGGQLINRLQDLGYRVQSLSDPKTLTEVAEREMGQVLKRIIPWAANTTRQRAPTDTTALRR